MLTAVLVTIATILVVGVAVFVFLRTRKGGSPFGNKLKIHSIDSVVAPTGASHASSTPGTLGSGGGAIGTHRANGRGTGRSALGSRLIAVGVIIGAALTALTGKLFFVQVLSGSTYKEQAEENLYTTVRTPAPRGVIYSAEGVPMVSNRNVLTILADSDVAEDHDVLLRLSALVGLPYDVIRNRILDLSSGAQSQRVVASDVSLREIAFITEHVDAFPGITTEVRTTRTYPYETLACHLLGYIGTASDSDLADVAEGRDIESGDSVGKSGVEAAYDSLLAGDHGQRVLVTDASGVIQEVVSETAPSKGNDIYLTVSAPVQRVAESCLKSVCTGKKRGSVVVMDVETGGIVCMASYPTYKPETFIGGISQDVWDEYQTDASGLPLLNRAISGTYPAGSTYKAITGLAAMAYGFAGNGISWTCNGSWTGFGDDYKQMCWLHSGHGTLAIRGAIVNSCDVAFYEIAKDFYQARNRIGIDAMQDFIEEYGYGAKTGIELSGESEGRVPTAEWKSKYFADAPEEAQWLPGDMSNMVIGQGYVLVTPLQVCRAYAAVATGKLLKPHLLKEVRNSIGDIVLTETVTEDATPEVSDSMLDVMRDALHGVTLEDNPIPTYAKSFSWSSAGKTGTAEVAGKTDFAWYAMYAPYEEPRFACACCVEEGGAGATGAAPTAFAVMDAAIRYDEGELGTNMDNISYTLVTAQESNSE